MNIEIEEKYNGVILKIKGDVIGDPDDTEFNNSIKQLIGENKKNIVVDFGNLGYVNSTGLGIIFRGYRKVKNVGGDIKLVSLNKKMKSLLSITKLDTIFDIYDTAETALNNMNV